MSYDVAIVGGGLAGCGAAIELARRGRRVVLFERKRYPIHKLCGEFLSGEAAKSLADLGVLDKVREAGAQAIERVVLNDCHGSEFECDLPRPALGISRYRLDAILWQRAIEASADCREGVAVRVIRGGLERGFCVATSAGEFEARVVLAAHGKRARLDQALGRSRATRKSPYVAFKAHFQGKGLGAIEMYGFPGGYCGVSPVEDGLVNVCWIAHEEVLAAAGGSVEKMVTRGLTRNPALGRRLELMAPAGKFQGIGNVVLGAKGTFAGDICLIGDAAGMIAPLCGDGMAMALRSAEIAAPLVSAFLATGDADSGQFKSAYTRAWEREFGLRLAIGQWANTAAFSSSLAHLSLGALRIMPGFGRWLIEKTRG